MKHRIRHNQLGRNTKQAKALYRGLIESLLEKGKIVTTQAKAKSVIGQIDQVINLAKADSINSKRQLIKILGSDRILDHLHQIAPKMGDRNSGYARIIKSGVRRADSTKIAYMELVDDTFTPASLPEAQSETSKFQVQDPSVELKKDQLEKKANIKKLVNQKQKNDHKTV